MGPPHGSFARFYGRRHWASVVLPVRNLAGARASLGPELDGTRLLVSEVDFLDERSVTAMRDAALARFGKIDHVAAPLGGWWQKGSSIEHASSELRDLLSVYVESPFTLLKALAPALRESRGSFMIVTGAAGEGLTPGAGLLTIAVRAQYALSRVLRQEMAGDPMRVNEVRIACRIEREPRPGVVPSRVAGVTFLGVMRGSARSEVLRYSGTEADFVSVRED